MENRRSLSTLSLAFILCFSPQPIMMYFGEECDDTCPLTHYTSTYGVPCSDSCAPRGYDYYWCNSLVGWDYCSPRNNADYKGNDCRADHPCDTYGEMYNWCYLKKGGWGKCARVEPKTKNRQTKRLKNCINDCEYYASKNYYWCYTKDGWDYCSPLPDVTYKYELCRSDHKCGTYGESYNWCYTTYNNDWDYCGVTSPGECMYSMQRRRKRSPGDQWLIESRLDNNGRTISFIAIEAGNDITSTNRRLRNEADDLINQWNNQRLGGQARSNLIRSNNLRIDLQSIINRNNQQFYNLQIQINTQRSSGESTTVSQIIVPVDTSAEDMRRAFRYSLENQARVEIEVANQLNVILNVNQWCGKRRH